MQICDLRGYAFSRNDGDGFVKTEHRKDSHKRHLGSAHTDGWPHFSLPPFLPHFSIVSRIAIQFYQEVWNEETGDIDHDGQSVDGSA